MISCLRGSIISRDESAVIVMCGGIGFHVNVPNPSSLPDVGNEIILWTHLRLREDAADLFGFQTRVELDLFESIQKIRGFPAKAALRVLSVCGVEGFREAVLQGDIKSLTAVPGVGKKLAQQLLLDLRGEIEMTELGAKKSSSPKVRDDAVLALVELGFGDEESRRRVEAVRREHSEVVDDAEIVKLALR